MKILFISNGFPPHRWAGTETYTAGVAEELLKRSHEVQVLCAGDWENGLRDLNGFTDDYFHTIPVRRINLNWTKSPDPYRFLYNNPVIADYLLGYLQEVSPDLVHITSCETLSASVIPVIRNAGIPLVLTLTDFWFLCPKINLLTSDNTNCDGLTTPLQCLRCQLSSSNAYLRLKKALPGNIVSSLLINVSKHPVITRQRGLRGMAGDVGDRKDFLSKAIALPDARITASQFTRGVHISNKITAPITILPYGHDLTWMKEYSGKTSSENIRIGFIGQIIQSKGIHLIIEALNLMSNDQQNKYSVYIFGDINHSAEYRGKLTELAGESSNIKYRGLYLHDDSAKIFSELDVLVVPSLWYDFPLVIYEAFATKTPVIATNLGGMAEAVKHGENGLLFECGNAKDLKNQLLRLVDEPDLLVKLRVGIPPVMHIQEHVDRLESIYCSLIQ